MRMADYETRPLSVYHGSEWRTMSARSSEPGPSSSRSGRSSLATYPLNARRRSSAASAPPAGPPPNVPIPSLPALEECSSTELDEDDYGSTQELDNINSLHSHSDPPVFDLNPFQRPTASSQLTAVAQFSQARLASAPVSPHSAVHNDLMDSPPRSTLPRLATAQPPPPPPSYPPPEAPSRQIVPDRLLLSPHESKENSAPNKPSSRRALTRALELAREAVRLDSTNDDPHGAIRAYGESVALLNEVMERVMRGEDTDRRKNGRRRSIVAQEEEVRRLKSIHDTYADRMNILSLIYSIPTNGQPSSTSGSSRPGTPSSGTSRDSQPTVVNGTSDAEHHASLEAVSRTVSHHSISSDGSHTAPHSVLSSSSRDNGSETTNGVQIPGGASNRLSNFHSSKQVQSATRLRSTSNIPPRPPQPSNSPPSTPLFQESRVGVPAGPPSPHLAPPPVGGRSRGSSVSHSRGGSGSRLEALREESGFVQKSPSGDDIGVRGTSVNGRHKDSPPLPALPSPSNPDRGSFETPRGSVVSYQRQNEEIHSYALVRPRNGSSVSEPEGHKSTHRLINESTGLGTISQRREKNRSVVSPIPEGSVDGSNEALTSRPSVNHTSTASSGGRGRASSHPVRPSAPISGLPTELGLRHPFQISGQNTTVPQPRKSSIRQSPQPTRSFHHPSFPPSSFNNHGLVLVPPPPVLPEVSTTPSSPLPPMPPSDALRRPYHLMNLLGQTMASKSGGYITRRLHVPFDVWSQGGAKLPNLPEKIRVVEVLCEALADLQNASVEFAGPMSVATGMGMGVGSITRKDGEVWAMKLEEFSVVCDNVVSNFGKKLSVGEGFVVKKSSGVGSWGGKLSRQLDKLTNGKNLDSPVAYVQGLQRLFNLAQLLDEHTTALGSQPVAPVYAALPVDVRSSVELKLKRSSEFFATVVLTFVIRDLSQLLDKYAKKGEKWLAE